jgi:KAP family P-loop domain
MLGGMTDALCDKDCFDRKPFADKLTTAITVWHELEESAYVLSLNASFGAGKTTFLKGWQEDLKTQEFEALYLNAWESDMDEDPIMALVECLMEGLPASARGVKKLKESSKKLAGAVLAVSNKVVEHVTGVDVLDLTQQADGMASEEQKLQTRGQALYQGYAFKKKAYAELKEALAAYAANLKKKPLIILVDELDRVRPDYAVKFLEAIKHVFSVKGVCFVLAVDKGQLEKSVKQLYGDVDFKEYYRRFITREANLPEPTQGGAEKLAQRLLDRYFSHSAFENATTFGVAENEINELRQFMLKTCFAFSLTGRQIGYFIREILHFLAVVKSDPTRNVFEWYAKIAVLLLAFRIKDPDFYAQLKTHQATAVTLVTKIKATRFDESSKSIFICNALFGNLRSTDDVNDSETVRILKQERPDWIASDLPVSESLNVFRKGFGVPFGVEIGEKSRFKQLAEKYEALETFVSL